MIARLKVLALRWLLGVLVERVAATRLRPGDVLVVTSPRKLGDVEGRRLRITLSAVLPGHRALILDDGLTIQVLAVEGRSVDEIRADWRGASGE